MADAPYVFGWMADRSGCGYYRIELPVAEYIRRGNPGFYSTELDPETRERADVIIGQRIVGGPPSQAWQKWCDKADHFCVFEIDDDLFNIDKSNIAHRSFTPEYLANLRRNIEVAHAVTVTTDALANRLACLNDNIHVVPNRIPEWLTRLERTRADELTIGWAGSTSHVMDWDYAVEPIGRFLKRNSSIMFHAVGGVFPSMLAWPRQQMRSTRWMHTIADYYAALDFDIGVIPLRPHIFNQSKSNVKALEYAALGIPVVASNTGPYETSVYPGKTGYLVDYDHQWSQFLRNLANDRKLRAKMSYEAREWAKGHTVEGNLESWLAAWSSSVAVAA